MPSDGDIIVPNYSTIILGTTSVNVQNPDEVAPSLKELELLYMEGLKVIPDLRRIRPIRSYAGPRPLIGSGVGREISRTFTIIDHEEKDSITGLISIVGGKLTTYRLMAEKLSNLVAEKLGLSKTCKTHKYPLPGYYDKLDVDKLAKKANIFKGLVIRAVQRWGSLARDFILNANKCICLCEGVTDKEIMYSISKLKARTIGDVLRRTRASMGPCQGQNCMYKIAGILYDYSSGYEKYFLSDIKSHLRKRWSNIQPLIHGGLADQEMLTLAIYNMLGNFDMVVQNEENRK